MARGRPLTELTLGGEDRDSGCQHADRRHRLIDEHVSSASAELIAVSRAAQYAAGTHSLSLGRSGSLASSLRSRWTVQHWRCRATARRWHGPSREPVGHDEDRVGQGPAGEPASELEPVLRILVGHVPTSAPSHIEPRSTRFALRSP